MRYEFLEHTADAKFRAYGKTLEEAFCNAAWAMISVMIEPSQIKANEERTINVSGADMKSLLYNFLEEILFLLDSEGFFLAQVKELEIEGDSLRAVLLGDASSTHYETHGDVKAVTYNEMEIYLGSDRCYVQVVVDV